MTRFLCVGDLHLGAGADYGREPGDRLRDQERVWRRCLELAVEHDVDAVLFAGDAFHRRRPTPAELLAFQTPIFEAWDAAPGLQVVAIPGNHDVEAAEMPNALEVFGHLTTLRSRPSVVELGAVSVACLPWSPVSRLVAARGGGERDELNQEAAGLLAATARGLRAQIPAERSAVLLLHWSISGASTPTGVYTDDFREPVLDVDELASQGWDAVVAGHIHKAQALGDSRDRHLLFDGETQPTYGNATQFYVGSPAPVDFGEAQVPHGAWLLDLGGAGATSMFLPVESRPFVTIDVDLIDGETPDYGTWTNGIDGAVVRVRYQATEEQARRLEHAVITRELYAAGAHKVYAIQPDIVREQRARAEGVDETLAPLDAVDAWARTQQLETVEHSYLVDLTSAYLQEVST